MYLEIKKEQNIKGFVFIRFFSSIIKIFEYKCWHRKVIRNNRIPGCQFLQYRSKKEGTSSVFFLMEQMWKWELLQHSDFFPWLAFYFIQGPVSIRSCSVFFPCWPVFCLVGNLILLREIHYGVRNHFEGCFLFTLHYHCKGLKLTVRQYQIITVGSCTHFLLNVSCNLH